jgi:NAD(P)-dependent dehydrogenase (short-subunit alcohol dehydrogenase family)
MSQRLQNKRCLIVGGTTGIGVAAASRFLEEGASLVIAGRSAEKGKEAIAKLNSRLVVTMDDCGTEFGIMKEAAVVGGKEVKGSLCNSIQGKVSRMTIVNIIGETIVKENEIITGEHASKIELMGLVKIWVRSPMTCQAPHGVCQLCYGIDPATGKLVDEGKAVGITGPSHFFSCDASEPEQTADLFRKTIAFLGGLDVLYHVAGISGRRHGDGPLHECSLEGWQATVDANLKSIFLTNQQAVRHFLAQRQPGVILNMASTLAFSPSPRYFDTIAYAATKGGIVAMSRLAAASYGNNNIRVNVIAPGLIDTPMSERACHDSAIRYFLQSKQPLAGGPGRPEDCSDAAVFLCSDEARFITGAVLPVDGGWCVSEGQYE